MESSVKLFRAAESTSIGMPRQNPEPEFPNPCFVKENYYGEVSGPSSEATTL